MKEITFEDIKKHEDIKTYLKCGNASLAAMGFTEHSFAHATRVAEKAAQILLDLGFSERLSELAKIAGYMHDIGNVVNRHDHAQSSAVLAFKLLSDIKMSAGEIAVVVSSIGNHDEGTGHAVNPVSAALILADKSDVRRSRVRNRDIQNYDIHDRVNYAATESDLVIDKENKTITLKLTIDSELCDLMDYFEIFMGRMLMSRRAADYLGMKFGLVINNTKFL